MPARKKKLSEKIDKFLSILFRSLQKDLERPHITVVNRALVKSLFLKYNFKNTSESVVMSCVSGLRRNAQSINQLKFCTGINNHKQARDYGLKQMLENKSFNDSVVRASQVSDEASKPSSFGPLLPEYKLCKTYEPSTSKLNMIVFYCGFNLSLNLLQWNLKLNRPESRISKSP